MFVKRKPALATRIVYFPISLLSQQIVVFVTTAPAFIESTPRTIYTNYSLCKATDYRTLLIFCQWKNA